MGIPRLNDRDLHTNIVYANMFGTTALILFFVSNWLLKYVKINTEYPWTRIVCKSNLRSQYYSVKFFRQQVKSNENRQQTKQCPYLLLHSIVNTSSNSRKSIFMTRTTTEILKLTTHTVSKHRYDVKIKLHYYR